MSWASLVLAWSCGGSGGPSQEREPPREERSAAESDAGSESWEEVAESEVCDGPLLSGAPPRWTARQLRWVVRDALGVPLAAERLPQEVATRGYDFLPDAQQTSSVWAEAWLSLVGDAVDAFLGRPAILAFAPAASVEGVDGPYEVAETSSTWAWTTQGGAQAVQIRVDRPVEVEVGARLAHLVMWDDDGPPPDGPSPVVEVSRGGQALWRGPIDHDRLDDAWRGVSHTLPAGRHTLRMTWEARPPKVLLVEGLTVRAAPSPPPWKASRDDPRRGVVGCDPTLGDGDGRARDRACVEGFLARTGARLWRRPVPDDVLEGLVDTVLAAPTAEDGLSVALHALLLSPRLLYRPEVDGPLRDAWDRAAWLAGALWGSVPDGALLACAAEGGLRVEGSGPCGVPTQVDRMLADPRFTRALRGLVVQWLDLGSLQDPLARGDRDATALDARVDEVARMMRAAVVDDRPARDLFAEVVVPVDGSLAEVYRGDEGSRGGLVRTAAFLSATSDPSRSSLVRRGRAIVERLLCEPIGDPPEDLPMDAPSREDALVDSMMRQADPNCASCHRRIDPAGGALDPYGPDGRWRGPSPDAPPSSTWEGHEVGTPEQLVSALADDPRSARCVVDQLATWVHQRSVDGGDRCRIVEELGEVPGPSTGLGAVLRGLIDRRLDTAAQGALGGKG